MARSLALLALTGAAVVAAQATTVGVFLPTFDKQDLDASIVAVDSEKTTFFIKCPSSVDSDECGLAPTGQTIVYGPKTFSLNADYDGGEEVGTYNEEMTCKLDPAEDYVSCSVYVSQSYDGTTTSTRTVVSTTGYSDMIIPVTVTAGASKLKGDDEVEATATTLSTAAAPASTTGSADATATESGSSADSTSVAESASSASGSSAADVTSTPTASVNAAGAVVTQNAVLVGAAALVGGAAMLL